MFFVLTLLWFIKGIDVCAQKNFFYLPECLLIFQYSVQSAVIVLYFWKPFTRFRFLWDFVFEATFPPLVLWSNISYFRQATYDTCSRNTAEQSAVDFEYAKCIQFIAAIIGWAWTPKTSYSATDMTNQSSSLG